MHHFFPHTHVDVIEDFTSECPSHLSAGASINRVLQSTGCCRKSARAKQGVAGRAQERNTPLDWCARVAVRSYSPIKH